MNSEPNPCAEISLTGPYDDLHKRIASRLFNVSYEDVTPLQRHKAKERYWHYLYMVNGDKKLADIFKEDICARDWTP